MSTLRGERRAGVPPLGGTLALLALWTIPALISTAQSWLLLNAEQQQQALWRQLATQVPLWWYWVAATPVIAWLLRRFPLEQGLTGAAVAVHLGSATVSAVLHSALTATLGRLFAVPPPGEVSPPWTTWWLGYLRSRFTFEVLIYLLVLSALLAITWYRRLRERELASSKLEAALSDAELRALKMQLHPHFLFNTLHAISVLIRENPPAAQRTVTLLGDLLRSTLANPGVQQVSLREELTFLRPYLEIEEIRFQDRLRIRLEIDPAVEQALVPNLILQPLVENAVRHAVEPQTGAGTVVVRARADGAVLELSVLDDGPGLAAVSGNGHGIGLSNTRARLEGLYGSAGTLRLEPRAEGGLAVTIRLPLTIQGA
ncbi:MAG: histidine kinase [Gemmatimonadales bacterium]